ncbi:MAG: gamma-glutamyl-gamma-aminobutyrate hydrolase family protein [Acidobacteriia bacterium]|nr:gamma-glutamyl-gamma-aminobutyrate hydrolase family protein [Terriglobia bacterium]
MPRTPRLLIIDPSVAFPEDEGAAEAARGWPGEVRVLRPALRPGDGPRPGDGYEADGIVLLGSRASANDDLPWLRDLGAWLLPVLRGEMPLPLLGICFGHQLVGKLAGGTVGYLHEDRHAELGVRESILDGSRLLPDTLRMRVVASHGEEVKELPPGYRIVARRPPLVTDGLEHQRLPIFTVQFHPEARQRFLTRRGADPSGLDAVAIVDNDRLLDAFRRLALAPG